MTANELRKKVASIMTGWVGGREGSAIHKEILKTYNSYAEKHGMAKAYESYAWCDITASAAWIKAGMAAFVPIAMSCGQSISKAKSLGVWKESDSYVPKVGDGIIYDWEDDGRGDDTEGHDHIGIVVTAGKTSFTVVEGNAGSPSQVRRIKRTVNQRYIRGFITPNYTAAAKALTPTEKKPTEKKPAEKKPTVKKPAKNDHVGAKTFTESKAGTYRVEARAGLYLRKGPSTLYDSIAVMPYKSTCVCYGYHTDNWYLVQYKDFEGFCYSSYLRK